MVAVSKKPKYPKKAEFTAKWWVSWLKNTPQELQKDIKKIGKIDHVITSCLVAKDLVDKKLWLDALKKFRDSLVLAIKACDKHRDYEARTLLQQLLLIHKKDTTAAKKLTDVNNVVPVKQKIKRGVVIWKRNLADEVEKVYEPRLMRPKKFDISLELNGDLLDLFEKEKDYATPQFMVEDAQKACAATVKIVANYLKSFDTMCAKSKIDPKKASKAVQKAIVSDFEKLQKKIEKIPNLRWKKFVASKQQWKKYKVVSTVKLGMGSFSMVASGVGIGANVAGMIIAPASIVGAVPGLMVSITSLLTSSSKTIQELISIGKSAEKVQKSLLKNVKLLKMVYFKEKKSVVASQEIGRTILNTLLTVPIKKGISACDSDYKLLDNKVAGLTVKGRKLSIEFEKLRVQVEKLAKSMKKIKGKKASEVLGKVKVLRVKSTKAFEVAAEMNARVKKLEGSMSKIKPMLNELKKKNTTFAKKFDKYFPILVDTATALLGFGAGTPDLLEGGLKSLNVGISLASDLIWILDEHLVEEI